MNIRHELTLITTGGSTPSFKVTSDTWMVYRLRLMNLLLKLSRTLMKKHHYFPLLVPLTELRWLRCPIPCRSLFSFMVHGIIR